MRIYMVIVSTRVAIIFIFDIRRAQPGPFWPLAANLSQIPVGVPSTIILATCMPAPLQNIVKSRTTIFIRTEYLKENMALSWTSCLHVFPLNC